jgi:hypothetical protein
VFFAGLEAATWLPGEREHAVRATAGEADGRRGQRLPKNG